MGRSLISLRAQCVALVFAVMAPVGVQAQDQTLADIRQELSVVFVEVQRLKRELSTTGAPGGDLSGTSSLERINSIEAELKQLTSKTEQLENRINRVVVDGTNRIGDLEFRLVELEGGDLSQLGETSTLGGEEIATTPPVAVPANGASELAVGERSDFDLAKTSLETGDLRLAADQFNAFTKTYPGSPLSSEAHFLRGQAHEELGEISASARAYLDSFSGAPNGPLAPDALFKLGAALGALGQSNEACVTLGEVGIRFPNAAAVSAAHVTMQTLGCG